MITLVTASANAHKVAEIQAIINELSTGDEIVLLPRPEIPDIEEHEDTLIGNAKLKALAVMEATGMPSMADDTGLFVEALGGAPGVHSARYAGDAIAADGSNRDSANRMKLLAELGGAVNRSAEFRSVTVVAWPDRSWTIAEGVLNGTIAHAEVGTTGFGYDQVFIPEASVNPAGLTYAQMGTEEKNAISHRRRAVVALVELLRVR